MSNPRARTFESQQQFFSQDKERRGSSRFPIEQVLRYRVLSKKGDPVTGSGVTVNMSSSGLLFATDDMLPPGKTLEMDVNWPAQLNNTCALKLVARGRVVRFEDGKVAVEIQHHEFRTRSRAT